MNDISRNLFPHPEEPTTLQKVASVHQDPSGGSPSCSHRNQICPENAPKELRSPGDSLAKSICDKEPVKEG